MEYFFEKKYIYHKFNKNNYELTNVKNICENTVKTPG